MAETQNLSNSRLIYTPALGHIKQDIAFLEGGIIIKGQIPQMFSAVLLAPREYSQTTRMKLFIQSRIFWIQGST